jgi:hypothetical protein
MASKRIIVLAAVSILAAACSGSPTGPTGPTTRDLAPSLNAGGVPNDRANCHGPNVAAIAQRSEGGFAGFAATLGLSVQEAQGVVQEVAVVKCLRP